MKITHFVENLERGGLERVVIDLIRAQREAGDECRVVCLFERGALADELDAQGVEVHACHKRLGFDARALRRARALLRQQRGGVLHTHNAVAHYHGVLATVGLKALRIVNTRHGMCTGGPQSRRERLYGWSMRMTDVAVAVCDAARRQFETHGLHPRGGLQVIPNGIRVERFVPTDPGQRQALAIGLGLPADTRLIGTVGRLNPVKDQRTLLRAFAAVHAELPDTALVLIGDGAMRAELERLALELRLADAVVFLGDRNDVHELLRGLEVFALSSVSEGYSLALLEASATALPIVATDVGGNGEIVRHGVSGELVAPGDAASLADALLRMLQDRSRAARMGQAGREWALREGSFRTMAQRYASLYAGHVE